MTDADKIKALRDAYKAAETQCAAALGAYRNAAADDADAYHAAQRVADAAWNEYQAALKAEKDGQP